MHDKPTYNPQIHHRRSIRLKGYDYSQEGLYFITICCKDRKYRFGKIENHEMTLNEYGMIAYNEWIKLTERFSNFELDVFQIMPNHMHAIIALNNVGAGFTPAHNKPVRAGFTPAHNSAQNNDLCTGFTPTHNKPVRAGFTPALYSAQNNDVCTGITPTHNKPVRAGFTPAHNSAQNNDEIYDQSPNGQPQMPLHLTDNDNRATAMDAHTIGDIIGAYKSLVANECLKIWKTKWVGANPAPKMGKLWQTNYHEHIIRNQQSYQKISEYIVNNPAKWLENKFYI